MMRYHATEAGQGPTAAMVDAISHTSRSRTMHLVAVLIALLVLPAPLGAVAQADSGATLQPVVVTFASADGSTFRTVLDQPADIASVEAALAGDSYAGIPNGALAYGDGGINAPHGWRLEGTTLADVTIEVCDGTAAMVDADLTYWVETVGRFCPWSATVLAVEPVNPPDVGEELGPGDGDDGGSDDGGGTDGGGAGDDGDSDGGSEGGGAGDDGVPDDNAPDLGGSGGDGRSITLPNTGGGTASSGSERLLLVTALGGLAVFLGFAGLGVRHRTIAGATGALPGTGGQAQTVGNDGRGDRAVTPGRDDGHRSVGHRASGSKG